MPSSPYGRGGRAQGPEREAFNNRGGSEDYFGGAPYLAGGKAASYLVDLVHLAMPEYPAMRISDPDLILRPSKGKISEKNTLILC